MPYVFTIAVCSVRSHVFHDHFMRDPPRLNDRNSSIFFSFHDVYRLLVYLRRPVAPANLKSRVKSRLRLKIARYESPHPRSTFTRSRRRFSLMFVNRAKRRKIDVYRGLRREIDSPVM